VGNESVLCPVCQGVLPADGREAYTPLRGRLILTNGYCPGGCAERRAAHVEQVRQRQAPGVGQPVPQAAPQGMSQGVQQPVPQPVSQPVPQAVPQSGPQAGPQSAPQLPQRVPQAAPVGPGVRVPR
jgi:hypothetical protein